MNENEIDRIAAMGNALRPDWPLPSLRTLLNKPELVNRSRRDVAVALAWVACDSKTKTPARVIEAGPWWQAVADPTSIGAPRVKSEDRCMTCNYSEEVCKRLAAQTDDRHAFVRWGDYLDGVTRPARPSPDAAAKARAALRTPNYDEAELAAARDHANHPDADRPDRNEDQ